MKLKYFTTIAASLAIASCGGGGGGGSDTQNNPPPVPIAGLTITGDNAVAAAKASYEAALGSSELTDLGDSLGFSASGSSGFAKPAGHTGVSGFLVDVLQKIPFGPDESPCAVSGSVTISGSIENPLTLSPGDTFLIESTACDEGLGEVVDGILEFTVAAFEGDVVTGAYAISIDATIDDLQVTTAEDTITTNGDALVSLDTRSAPSVTASVSGDSMTRDANALSDTLRAYSTELTQDGATAVSTMIASGTLDTTSLDGAIDFSTPLRFEIIGTGYPHVGELFVEGDSSSALLVTVDDVEVRIEIDLDANGSIDEIINTTWAELDGG